MTDQEMFEKSFERPRNFFLRSFGEQWHIDSALDILDWQGINMTKEDVKRYNGHYFKSRQDEQKWNRIEKEQREVL